jgi:hypothetical protein
VLARVTGQVEDGTSIEIAFGDLRDLEVCVPSVAAPMNGRGATYLY